MKERIEGARPMMDLMAKKIFSKVKFQRNCTLDGKRKLKCPEKISLVQVCDTS